MSRRWIRWTWTLVLSLGALSGCAEGPVAPARVHAPEAVIVRDTRGDEYTLVEGRIPDLVPDLQLSKVIDADGGSISLAGHKLTVPAGAVRVPTIFTLTLPTNGYVQVELSAAVPDLLGNLVDVGGRGFLKPVTLSLTYAWASNVSDPADLLILWKTTGGHAGAHQPLPSVIDTQTRTVSAKLEHFSAYCMAEG